MELFGGARGSFRRFGGVGVLSVVSSHGDTVI